MKEGLCLVGVRGIYSVYVYWHCACENNTHSLCKVMDLPGWSNEYSPSLCILLRLSVQNLFEFDLTNFISNPHWDIRFSFINSHILSLSLSLSLTKGMSWSVSSWSCCSSTSMFHPASTPSITLTCAHWPRPTTSAFPWNPSAGTKPRN